MSDSSYADDDGDDVLIGCSACDFYTTAEAALAEHRQRTGHGCFRCPDAKCRARFSELHAAEHHAQNEHGRDYKRPVVEKQRLFDASTTSSGRSRGFYSTKKQ